MIKPSFSTLFAGFERIAFHRLFAEIQSDFRPFDVYNSWEIRNKQIFVSFSKNFL